MSELAFNFHGEPFEVPAVATGWRVRRMKPKGPPEVVYGRAGVPLLLPIDAGLDDLRGEVDVSARYRLDPVDDHGKLIATAPSGYVHVNLEQPAVGEATAAPTSDSLVTEALRMNTELARAVIERFPQMMEAAATLLRAADGAGLPARLPVVRDDNSDDSDDAPTAPRIDLATIAAQVAPAVIMALTGDRSKLPSLAEMLDWRKATPKPDGKPTASRAAAAPAAAILGMPEVMERFSAVLAKLTPDERALALAMASELSPDERAAWLAELGPMSVDDAAARVRSALQPEGDAP